MAANCTYTPTRNGVELKGFKTFRKELGYRTAVEVFYQALSPEFQEKFKSFIEFDDQGVPTYESVARIPYVKKVIGTTKLMTAEQKKFSYIPNTRENYRTLLQQAYNFNNSSESRDIFTAVVTPTEDNSELRVEIRLKGAGSDAEFQNQYGSHILNERLSEIFADLGVTPELLERFETSHGYIDFSKASNIADGFKGLINIANNMQGELALSEEFAHLIIGLFRDDPLIQRSLHQLEVDDALVREILGDEYDRNVQHYSKYPNHNSEGEEMSLQESLAEEALGRLLQEKMKNQATSTTTNERSSVLRNFLNRILNMLKRIFKGRDVQPITNAKAEADAGMGELARQFLSGERKITDKEFMKARRDAKFHQVGEEVDKVIQILKNARNVERKRAQIVNPEREAEIKRKIIQLDALINDQDKLEGLHLYAQWAIQDLKEAMDSLTIEETFETNDFRELLHVKNTLDSYGDFIEEFSKVLDDIGNIAVINADGNEINLRELWRDIDELYSNCRNTFNRQALATFSDFLAPVYKRSPLRDEQGNIRDIKDVLTGKDFDISEFDRWCASMGNSSSTILQMYDWVVKGSKSRARERTTDDLRKIWRLRDNIEKRGITSFGWIYERDNEGHKTGNYISEYNYGQFEKDKKEMEENLAKKYGKNPIGENFVKAKAERIAWYDSHAIRAEFGSPVPNESYRNPAYARLTSAQKESLKEILDYKDMKEALLPPNKRDRIRAIQRRRSGFQRITDALSDMDQTIDSLEESISQTFKRKEDDDQLFGDRTKGLTDFTGKEYMTLPILYTNRLKNPDELSDDIFGDLMVYTHMANTYDEVNEIYAPLELGLSVVGRKEFIKNAGAKKKEEVLNYMGQVTKLDVKVGDNTLFERKLRDFMECQVYGRYLKDEGEIFGVDKQKAVSFLQRISSTAYLGCNILAGIANVFTAVGMQHIEMAAGEYFGAKELAKADFNYFTKLLPAFMAELGSRTKQSELALFDELFDVKQNAKDKLHNVQMKNILRRFFGQNWLFIQQGMGDHWIYNRTAIAMAMKRKVKVNGKVMSVWEARKIVTDETGYKKMIIDPAAKNLDGSDFKASDFSREIADINHDLTGIYNDEDQNAANRVVIGRMLQQMRKWIIPQMMRRFQTKRSSITRGKDIEGYYVTTAVLIKDIWKSGFKITAEWKKLDSTQKGNVHRAIAEMAQYWALWFIVMSMSGKAKDPDRGWKEKFMEYYANRELHELGFLAPSPSMPMEIYKTIQSPSVILSALNSVAQFAMAAANPNNWFLEDDELIQSGPYKGHGPIYKRFMQLPLPPFTQFRQIDKFIEDLDTGTRFYARDYK